MPPVADPKVDANIIEQVRSQVLDILHPHYDTPFNFLRWLQSYEFNVSKTVYNLRKHLKWRKERHLDEDGRGLQSSPITTEYAPLSVVGWNRQEKGNYLIVVDQSGRIDIGGVMKSIQPTEYLHQLYRNFEKFLDMIMEMEAETGVQCSLLYIFDLDGLSFDPTLLSILSGPFRVSWQCIGTHYREFIGRFVVINTPSYINVLWSALSPFVPEQAKSRIIITGRSWRDDLLELADVECLPERYGGKIPDEKVLRDPKPVPKDLYWRPKPDFPSVASMHRISTPAVHQNYTDQCPTASFTEGLFTTGISALKERAQKSYYYRLTRSTYFEEIYVRSRGLGLRGESEDYNTKKKTLKLESLGEGKTRTMTYFVEAGTELQIYTQNDSDVSFGIFFSEKETAPEEELETLLPSLQKCALPAVDLYNQEVTHTGYYHLRFTNDAAWLFSSTYKVFVQEKSGGEIKAVNQKEKWIKQGAKAK